MTRCTNIIFEDVVGGKIIQNRMQAVSTALEELLVAAQKQESLTMGIYESAKLMNADPDSVVLCVLAADEDDENDVALQIHFTLLQAFCCDSGITILRVTGVQRLEQLLGQNAVTMETESGIHTGDHRDLHCILVTQNPEVEHSLLQEVGIYCQESRRRDQWVPELILQKR